MAERAGKVAPASRRLSGRRLAAPEDGGQDALRTAGKPALSAVEGMPALESLYSPEIVFLIGVMIGRRMQCDIELCGGSR